MNDITSEPLKDQPWIKENMLHLHKMWIIAIFQILITFLVLACGLTFFICLGFILQISIVGFDAEMGITISLAIIGIIVSTIFFKKFMNHLNFLGISLQKHQQLQAWNYRTLVGLALFGVLFFIPIYLFLLVNNLQNDAKKRLANNEPCFIKKEQHQADFLPPSFPKTPNN